MERREQRQKGQKGKRWRLLRGVLVVLLAIAAGEAAIRGAYALRNSRVKSIPVPYFAAHTFAELPPWYDSLRSLEYDAKLLWKTRPNIERRYLNVFDAVGRVEDRLELERGFFPSSDESMKRYSAWEMSSNALGFRDDAFRREKDASTFRIVCMGDSWTFSVNADQRETYPRRLEEHLRQAYPDLDIEVLNFGVMGYSSFQGLELFRSTALAFEPDVVLLGYGMNDGQASAWSDEDIPGYNRQLKMRLRRLLQKSEMLKLARYFGTRIIKGHKPPEGRIETTARWLAESKNPDGSYVEIASRVSPEDYEQNLREMIAMAREHGSDVVLLFNELHGLDGVGPPLEGRFRAALERISRSESVPLVDSSVLIAESRERIELELEERFQLQPAGENPPREDGRVDVVFRLHAGEHPVSERMYIAGAHEALGNNIPNSVAMYDDGSHGDQRAADGVWSWSGTFQPGETLSYVYTNSGPEGEWEGLDVPYVRTFEIDASATGTLYHPIETFGTVHMQTDASHTGAAGYDLIAQRVFDALHEVPRFQEIIEDDVR